jgi:hypothetical protein
MGGDADQITDIVESTPMSKLEMGGMKARGDHFADVEPVLAGYRCTRKRVDESEIASPANRFSPVSFPSVAAAAPRPGTSSPWAQ